MRIVALTGGMSWTQWIRSKVNPAIEEGVMTVLRREIPDIDCHADIVAQIMKEIRYDTAPAAPEGGEYRIGLYTPQCPIVCDLRDRALGMGSSGGGAFRDRLTPAVARERALVPAHMARRSQLAAVTYYHEYPLGDVLTERPVVAPPPAGVAADEWHVQQFSPARVVGRTEYVVMPNDMDMISGALDVNSTNKVPDDLSSDKYSYIREMWTFPSQYTDANGATSWKPCEVELSISDVYNPFCVTPDGTCFPLTDEALYHLSWGLNIETMKYQSVYMLLAKGYRFPDPTVKECERLFVERCSAVAKRWDKKVDPPVAPHVPRAAPAATKPSGSGYTLNPDGTVVHRETPAPSLPPSVPSTPLSSARSKLSSVKSKKLAPPPAMATVHALALDATQNFSCPKVNAEFAQLCAQRAIAPEQLKASAVPLLALPHKGDTPDDAAVARLNAISQGKSSLSVDQKALVAPAQVAPPSPAGSAPSTARRIDQKTAQSVAQVPPDEVKYDATHYRTLLEDVNKLAADFPDGDPVSPELLKAFPQHVISAIDLQIVLGRDTIERCPKAEQEIVVALITSDPHQMYRAAFIFALGLTDLVQGVIMSLTKTK